MTLLVALVVFLAVTGLVRLLLSYLHFRRLELAIPGPPSLPLLGNTIEFLDATVDNVLHKLLTQWGGRYAQLSRVNIAGRLLVFVSDPDHMQELFRRKDMAEKDPLVYSFFDPIGHGLVPLNGEMWRLHRKAIQPAFHQSVLDRYTSVFSTEALSFVRSIRPGEVHDVEHTLESLMVRSFVWTAIAVEELGEDEVERVLPEVQSLIHSFAHSFVYRLVQPWLWPGWAFDLTAKGRNIKRRKAKVDVCFRDSFISARRKELELQRGRVQEDKDDLKSRRRTLLDVLLVPGSPLSDDEILDELYLIGGAATETTVATLGWVLKTLSLRHGVQELLLQEMKEVLGMDRKMHITVQDLDRLEYTERVIKETLRLLPGVPIVARGLKKQTEFCGHTLPAGSTLMGMIVGAHRHPKHWPDPLRFDPDRFLPERSQGRHPYAYLPFSAGSRSCIGGRYGMMIMKTLLATLVPRYRIDPVDDGLTEPADFPMSVGIASRMVGGVRVVFTPRVDCSVKS